MRYTLLLLALPAALLAALPASAAIRYVDLNSVDPGHPYTEWHSAAHVIQDAVDAAEPGDTVLVADGVYATGGRLVHLLHATNRVAITNPITVRSVNGPNVTVIEGYQVPGTTFGTNAVRCVYLANGAMLAGFTLTNGSTRDLVYQDSGGGVHCESASAIVSNCVIVGNAAIYQGGGAYRGTLINCTLAFNSATNYNDDAYAGGASYATLIGCLVVSNFAQLGGGGVGMCVLNNCTLIGNTADGGGGSSVSFLTNCTVTGNRAAQGGGIYFGATVASTISSNSASDLGGGAYGGDVQNSVILDNVAPVGGGMYAGSLRACVVAGNSAAGTTWRGNLGGGLYEVDATNCTITGNSAGSGGGARGGILKNCIVYYNYSATGLDLDNHAFSTMDYCCTAPQPASGTGNIFSEPNLLSATHIHASSPCLGGGHAAYVTGNDIDGEAWRSAPAIGCDEHHSVGTTGLLSAAIQSDYTNVGRTYPVNFAARISGRPDAVRWDFGDGTVVSNRGYVSHRWTTAGNYPVVLTAFNKSFAGGISATALVHVLDQVHYVSGASASPVTPYLSWATAANNIQQAIDAASVAGAVVLVSNGVYSSGARLLSRFVSNRVAVTKPLIIQSLNGPTVTTIRGTYTPAVRGVYLTNGAILSGFTIANGGTSTAGDSQSDQSGAGVYCESSHAVISNCVIAQSRAWYQGGGVRYGTLYQCVVSNNTASFYGGGVYSSVINNSLVTSNYGGTGGGAYFSRATNCTLVGNHSGSEGGGIYGGVAWNCIVYSNLSVRSSNNYAGADLSYCCTTPLAPGIGNFTNNPTLMNQAGSNFRLRSDSPCINSGRNAEGSVGPDLDGNLRIVGGTVDIGAYEFQSPQSVISFAWLQRYGLPVDGSADFIDGDNDHANTWQEWKAWTDPADESSVLRMLTPQSGTNGTVVDWRSVSGQSYVLERATDLNASFSPLRGNIIGQAGTTSYTDTNAAGGGSILYRVGARD